VGVLDAGDAGDAGDTGSEDTGNGDAGDDAGSDAGGEDGSSDGSDDAGDASTSGPAPLWDGPVSGPLPGWDPSVPIPLVAIGQPSGSSSWYATLVRIAADGTLSENLAERILIFGFDDDPPALIYDGPVGGQLPNWNSAAPIPLVMMGRIESQDAWTLALAEIASDGTTSGIVVDRLVVWGWRTGGPTLLYQGPVPGTLPGWDAALPSRLVMGGALNGSWYVTLARVDADGTLAENLSETLTVWGW
jgi:hypothetical protein